MGNVCRSEEELNQSIAPGQKIKSPKQFKNMPSTSYAYQVKQPEIHRNVQIALNDPKLQTNKKVELQGKPFFYIIQKKAYYQGDFNKNKMPQGFGIAIFQDGTYYEGQFQDGQANDDQAVIIFPNGGYYKGQIKNSKINGQGIFVHKNIYTYEGKWANGVPEGNGIEKCNNQNISYMGQFKSGFKQGKGIYSWDNGSSKFVGEFNRGLMHDKSGKIQVKGGIKYSGEFKHGKREGRGAIETENGVLEGNFKNDELNGEGRFVWTDGKIYEGNFKKSQFDGKGKIIYPNNKVVQGEWQRNHNKYVQSLIA